MIYPITCLAEATLGSPNSKAFFSSISKSALPAWWRKQQCISQRRHLKDKKGGGGGAWAYRTSTLPQFEPQVLCQNSHIACEQAQLKNHPFFYDKKSHLVSLLGEKKL
jgi:hypothetical protein